MQNKQEIGYLRLLVDLKEEYLNSSENNNNEQNNTKKNEESIYKVLSKMLETIHFKKIN